MTAKKKTRKDASSTAVAAPPDLREVLPQNAASWAAVLLEVRAVLADLAVPTEPKRADFIEAMLHIYFADHLPCGFGQEARRRILTTFVDRNEFRVTEAFEVEDMLSDLQIPNLFDRCLWVRESVAQVYNDQNGVKLDFLLDAGIGDRANFFTRTPALRPHAALFINNLLTMEELCFSDKSLARVQLRLGMDPKDAAANAFVSELRTIVKPYGHLPLEVGAHLGKGKPNLSHNLSPACCLVRLLPATKKRG
ncbi:hypothetical protein LBMAG49_19510 [Planctomycetota bacterium]|nr:hypothetical protein [Planctomycetota bacterium]GDY02622.1 hypothetical protein LBMAG49_19510 [Planctomycetota bacterium]